MCNFMGVRVTKIQFIRLKKIEKELGTLAAMKDLEEMKDGFKYSNSVIIKAKADMQDIDIVAAHWEFIPSFIKDMAAMVEQRKKGIPFLNAKSEHLFLNAQGKPAMWASAARTRRCLVLVSHFFEWRHYKPEGAKKAIAYPYLIHLPGHDYFYMAGIYNTWTDKSTGETMDTFAIVTTKANDLMAEVHNTKMRMPTILPEDLAWRWIMEDLTDEEIKSIASYQISSEVMNAYSIHKDFKVLENPLEPFEYEELPHFDFAQ